mmetsp:Transcript_103161/g.330757  ORF Transcript_103161/g.330757 Transcript_103161/m.330757 type:complete len:511 (+) Transcript_103161:139-1671(+)
MGLVPDRRVSRSVGQEVNCVGSFPPAAPVDKYDTVDMTPRPPRGAASSAAACSSAAASSPAAPVHSHGSLDVSVASDSDSELPRHCFNRNRSCDAACAKDSAWVGGLSSVLRNRRKETRESGVFNDFDLSECLGLARLHGAAANDDSMRARPHSARSTRFSSAPVSSPRRCKPALSSAGHAQRSCSRSISPDKGVKNRRSSSPDSQLQQRSCSRSISPDQGEKHRRSSGNRSHSNSSRCSSLDSRCSRHRSSSPSSFRISSSSSRGSSRISSSPSNGKSIAPHGRTDSASERYSGKPLVLRFERATQSGLDSSDDGFSAGRLQEGSQGHRSRAIESVDSMRPQLPPPPQPRGTGSQPVHAKRGPPPFRPMPSRPLASSSSGLVMPPQFPLATLAGERMQGTGSPGSDDGSSVGTSDIAESQVPQPTPPSQPRSSGPRPKSAVRLRVPPRQPPPVPPSLSSSGPTAPPPGVDVETSDPGALVPRPPTRPGSHHGRAPRPRSSSRSSRNRVG